ncbi:hypothetical protein CASFOL_013431 [Castilleja foliolosa]|uniref:Uncharacterized protein n=1 Tax=Castilleja foliolosa TaxID=1961234 RepID=A0ABD3DLS2_9LAMI
MGHLKKGCYELIGYPDWFKSNPKFQEKGKEKGGVATAVTAGDAMEDDDEDLQFAAPAVALKTQPPRSGAPAVAEEGRRSNPAPHQSRRRESPENSTRRPAAALGKRTTATRPEQLETERGKKNDHRNSVGPITVKDDMLKKTLTSSADDGPSGPKKTGLHETAKRNGPSGPLPPPSAGPIASGLGLGPSLGPGLGSGPICDGPSAEKSGLKIQFGSGFPDGQIQDF